MKTWTREETQLLLELRPYASQADIATRLGRSPKSVERKIAYLRSIGLLEPGDRSTGAEPAIRRQTTRPPVSVPLAPSEPDLLAELENL